VKKYCILVCIFFIACQKNKSGNEGKTVFRYNEASGLNTMDPAFAKDQAIIWPCLQLYNGLVQLDDQLKIVPCIAKSWDISNNGKTYTFHLRQDVFFHKNKCFHDSTRKVTASDFLYSLERLTNPSILSPGAWIMNPVVKNDVSKLTGITALNDSTLEIMLTQSYPPFIGLLTMPYCSVVPKEAVEFYGADFRGHPCGTGPFKFREWKEGVKLILLKNENYFEVVNGKRLPHLDAVEVSFINDKQSVFIEFLKGKLDFLSGLDVSFKDELLTRSGKLQSKYKDRFQMETQPYLNTEYLGILMDGKKATPLQDVRIRKALNYGFDRNAMIAYLRNNMGTPGNYGMVPPGLPSFDSTVLVYGYDPVKARQLLAEAGYPNGKNLPAITLSTTTTYQDLCEFIKSQWEELGIKINIDVNQAAIHRKMVAEQKLDFFRASWIADYPDAENYLSLFYSTNLAPAGPNYTNFKNNRFDDLFNIALNTTNDSVRYVSYREMDKLIMDEAPVIILYYDKVLRLSAKNVTGLGSNAMNLLILKNVEMN
jgi:peptide/nickel transport system substrate-binding protein